MSLSAAVILIFFVLLILIALKYRSSTLDKLIIPDGEKILFEETGLRVEQGGSGRSTIFINCIVRVTDRRIIIAQKMLLSNRYALRYVITYSPGSDALNLGTALGKGYLIFDINLDSMNIKTEQDASVITIDIPVTMLTKGQRIKFRSCCGDDYRRIFGQ